MNFFQHQDQARKKTGFLIFSFILVICVILLVIGLVLLLVLKDQGVQQQQISQIILYANCGVLAVILLGTLVKYFKLRKGGKAISEMIDAVPVQRDTRDLKMKQLVNVVDEISIASGISSPMIFYMPNELAINAFVAGFDPKDTILVVTKGTLDNLNRDELQGVIAHEFSHIFNTDTKINMRMIAVLGGLFVLSQVGYNVLRNTSRSRSNMAAPIVGAAILLIGYVGLFLGNIIKSAVSRQREYLSDASAVQFTRNPEGISRALLKIADQGGAAFLKNKHSEDISHMCFSEAIRAGFFNPFSTHPPLDKRISALDPSGQIMRAYIQEKSEPKKEKNDSIKKEKKEETKKFPEGHQLHILAGLLLKSVGNPNAQSYDSAQNILSEIPEDLKEMTYNTQSAKELIRILLTEPPKHRMVLLDMAMPALKEMELKDSEEFICELFKIAKSDKNVSLYEAVLLTILGENLGRNADKQPKVLYKHLSQLQEDTACIFEYIRDPKTQKYSILVLVRAFKKLKHMSPTLKQEFLKQCVNIIDKDGKISLNELDLLRAICASMNCPLPRL